MRKSLAFVLVLFVVCAFSGCGGSGSNNPQDLIIGKWDVKQKFGNIEITGKTEFRKNGSMTTEAMGRKMESTYRFLDGHNIQVEMSVGGRKLIEKNKIESITRNAMVLVDPQGGKAIFSR